MASIRFIVKGKKNPSHIYVRFYHSKDFDEVSKIRLLINPNHWNNKLQRFKSIAEHIEDKEDITKRLEDLKTSIVSEYNKSEARGELITKQWLDNTVNKFNNRPTDENDTTVFFIPFIDNYIEESNSRINPDTGKPINIKTIRKYKTTSTRLKEFETKHKTKLKHIDIGLEFFTKFVSFLSIDGGYSKTTINKYISQVKMFCNEIKTKGYKYNPEYESRRFYVKRGETLDTYLNKDEIKKIFELEIKDERQDKIRDLFIIGLWTGLRVSDFSEIERLKIVGDNMLISATVKTIAPVKIPLHPQIKTILKKRGGKLPEFELTPKSLENLFNKEIKVICKNADIDEEIIGDLRNKETNRNERGIYAKHLLISSHTCRRSFITNHLNVLPDKAIMTITTHSSPEQLHRYNKKATEDYLEQVREHWEEERKAKLKVI
ncbi:tyrosine-type recombinase/integrase [Algibacter luteus]|uniref:Phage integrase SAM-like domain-containing protein n=1 Tax=Algibacter luteus TaxID=1178825 RepID=A0A1M6FG73_9FLAO|nr:phage integrase SAM-like domain-containing protein [Algibacter luteus]SHI96751.1 hypothetical protein SAMN05216261_2380 [Algibacter luteus]